MFTRVFKVFEWYFQQILLQWDNQSTWYAGSEKITGGWWRLQTFTHAENIPEVTSYGHPIRSPSTSQLIFRTHVWLLSFLNSSASFFPSSLACFSLDVTHPLHRCHKGRILLAGRRKKCQNTFDEDRHPCYLCGGGGGGPLCGHCRPPLQTHFWSEKVYTFSNLKDMVRFSLSSWQSATKGVATFGHTVTWFL